MIDITVQTEANADKAGEDYERLLAGAIAELESNEPALDQLDRRNRDEYAYVPTVEALYIAYKTHVKPSDDDTN